MPLSPHAFIARREDGEPILHPGHEPVADEPMNGERESVRDTERASRAAIA